MRDMKRARLIWLFAFVVVFGSTSVVLFSSTPSTERGEVAELTGRMTEFWECRIKGDYVTIYDLMSPEIRESITRPAFVGAKGFVNYYTYDIRSIEIEGDEARALVHYTWKANHPLFEKSEPKEHVMEDLSVRADDTWFRKFVKPSMVNAGDELVDDDLE